jgi:RNA polymerase sigma-70 factor (sigma-E family)
MVLPVQSGMGPDPSVLNVSVRPLPAAGMQPRSSLECSSSRVISDPTRSGSMVENLEAAYHAHYVALLRLATLLTTRGDLAEDLVQEAFVKAAGSLARLSLDEAKPYLRTTVLNLWRNRLRRRSLERRQRPGPDVATATPGFEEAAAMWDAVGQLPPRQRACLVLRFYEDLPVEETAELLGCSPGTVKSQTSRAIERLRQEWNA